MHCAVCLRGLQHTAEIVLHRGDGLCGVLQTAEIISAVCYTPQRLSPQCDGDCQKLDPLTANPSQSCLHGMHHTLETTF